MPAFLASLALGSLKGDPSKSGGSKFSLNSIFKNANFQSGFGTVNDIADSIGSLFGMGPVPRAEALQSSDTQHIVPMQNRIDADTSSMTAQNGGEVLTNLDKFISLYIKNIQGGRHKAANTKAKQKHEIDTLTEMRSGLRNHYKDYFNQSSRTEFLVDVDYNGDKLAQTTTYKVYTLKSSAVKQIEQIKQQSEQVSSPVNVSNNNNNPQTPKDTNTMTIVIGVVLALLMFGKKIFR